MHEKLFEGKSMIEKELRTEIIETQKARMDLVKWKLLLIAALGSAVLGLSDKTATGLISGELLLALVPLVCLFVDLLCYHHQVRILVIGFFLREYPKAELKGDLVRDYERFARHVGDRRVFSLEDWALWISTCFFSVTLLLLAFWELYNDGAFSFSGEIMHPACWVVISGLIVVAVSVYMHFWRSPELIARVRSAAESRAWEETPKAKPAADAPKDEQVVAASPGDPGPSKK